MLKKISALIIASAAFVGWLENPAHSGPIEEAALMVLAAGACEVNVPDSAFLPAVQLVAIQNDVNVTTAMSLIRSQAEIMALKLVETGMEAEFCQRAQSISFE